MTERAATFHPYQREEQGGSFQNAAGSLFASGRHLLCTPVIPEPATIGLVGMGASLCLLTRKRRGRQRTFRAAFSFSFVFLIDA